MLLKRFPRLSGKLLAQKSLPRRRGWARSSLGYSTCVLPDQTALESASGFLALFTDEVDIFPACFLRSGEPCPGLPALSSQQWASEPSSPEMPRAPGLAAPLSGSCSASLGLLDWEGSGRPESSGGKRLCARKSKDWGAGRGLCYCAVVLPHSAESGHRPQQI